MKSNSKRTNRKRSARNLWEETPIVIQDNSEPGPRSQSDNGRHITKPPIKRILKKTGIKRISKDVDSAIYSIIVDYTTRIGLALQVKGLMNIQYVIVGGPAYRSPSSNTGRDKDDATSVYVIEVNPRSSRTIPFISKVTGVPMVKLAVGAMLGSSLKDQGYSGGLWRKKPLVAVKAPVFSMSKLSGVDTYLGPEMKSTGEIMGIDVEPTQCYVS